MKISKLLSTRQALLRQTQLANLAYAYVTLQRFVRRISTANLRGLVRLCSAEPSEERFWPTLTALDGSQAVIEEHFDDHDLVELVDAVSFATGGEFETLEFRIEQLTDEFVHPVRQMLDHSGVVFDHEQHQSNVAADNAE